VRFFVVDGFLNANLTDKDTCIGLPGACALAKLLGSSFTLTSLDLAGAVLLN
jgi:hypothetical protein